MVKKILKILAITAGVLLSLLLLLPVVFKGKIVERVKYEINEQLDARVEFGRFGLSLIRQFPNTSLWVNDLRIIGEGDFEGDTLADIGRITVTVNLADLFRGDNYEIGRIRLDHPKLFLKILSDGSANWDIMAVSAGDADLPDGTSEFSLGLKRVEIRSGDFVYHDDLYVTYIDAGDINAVLHGDLSMSQTSLATRDATISSFSLRYDQWPVLSRVAVNLTAEMDADLDSFVFTFRDNLIQLNELPLVFEGMIGWPVEDLEMDFRFASARSDFASFLSLLPAIYTQDFQSLQTDGSLKLEGHVKGAYTDAEYPGFGLTVEIENGMFRYPDLPAAVDGVKLLARIDNRGGDLDYTVIDIPVFKMALAGMPVEAMFRLKTPISDPDFDIRLSGNLDLSRVGQFYPLEDGIVLRGVIEANMAMRGTLSAFERGEYDVFHAEGTLVAHNLYAAAPMVEDALEISIADFRFAPKEITMQSFQMQFGGNDLSASGQIDNLPGYLFDDQLLKASFTTASSYFDINYLMKQMPQEGTDVLPEDAGVAAAMATDGKGSAMSVIRIPANIDFSVQSGFDKLIFGDLEISNVNGIIHMADEQLNMENLIMDMLGGTLVLNGYYDSRDLKPWVNLGLKISGFDIGETFGAFVTARVLAPVAEYARGKFSADLQVNTLLDQNLSPLLSSLSGKGGLSASSVLLQSPPVMASLSDKLQMDQFKEMSVKDLLLSFAFSDGKVEIPPFSMNLGNIKASMAGEMRFDQRINYVMSLEIPREMFGGRANLVFDDLISRAAGLGVQFTAGEVVPLDITIGGTFRQPDVSVSMAPVRENLEQRFRDEADRLLREAELRIRDETDVMRDRLEAEAQDRLDDSQRAIRAELEARANQIMEEANSQAASIRSHAGEAAGRVRAEAAEQARRLEQEASGQGPIAQAAAARAAQQIIREADRRATQIEAEAERNVQKLLDEAKQKADAVRSEE